MKIGIAGAGLLGRLLAWQLSNDGHAVSVFDPAADAEPRFDGHGAAAFSAAGMLSPTAELDHADRSIAELGWRGVARWRDIAAQLGEPQSFVQRGSLLLAHRGDRGAAERVLARLGVAAVSAPEPLDAARLAAIEPALQGSAHAWLLPDEAQVDPLALLCALHARSRAVQWQWGRSVAGVEPGALRLADSRTQRFDLAIDVRGVGARSQTAVRGEDQGFMPLIRGEDQGFTPLIRGEDQGFTPLIRGVRGETVWLHAPGHGLTRPVRLLHPRHRVYLVPRAGDIVFVGASEIESEDRSEVSLRSAVELMAAAHSVMPALAEARIVRLDRNLRPALPDNAPRIEVEPGMMRINGLFRHGWLVAPALVDDALRTAMQVAALETAA